MQSIRATAFAGLLAGATIASILTAGTALAQTAIRVIVNGEAITSNEIAQRARFLRVVDRQTTGASVERAAMEELVEEKLKLQEAKRVGITVGDPQVEAAFASIAARLKISPAQLAAGLSHQGISPRSLKERLRGQIIWQQLVVGRFNRTVSISDSQIVDALAKKEPGAAKTGGVTDGKTAEYTLQQVVLVVAQKGGNADARMREAEALRARVTSCDGLVEAVKPLPEALVKSFGKRTEDELPDNFRGLLADVPVGRLSKPIRSAVGVEMIAVCGKRDLSGDFQIRSKVEDEIRAKEGEVFARRYMNDLRRIAVIDYRK